MIWYDLNNWLFVHMFDYISADAVFILMLFWLYYLDILLFLIKYSTYHFMMI